MRATASRPTRATRGSPHSGSGARRGGPPHRERQRMTTFAELGLAPDLVAALGAQGIEDAFPIQAMTIADAMAGRGVCGKAKTGSGKTLGFGLPLIERTDKSVPRRPRALILVPTRELAVQVRDVLQPLAAIRKLRTLAVYGGAPIEKQMNALDKGVDIMIATPGRLIDLGDRGNVSVADVRVL